MLRPKTFRNRPLPETWLMTDARFGDDLIPAIRRLPQGSGVILRHYNLAPADRRKLFKQVQQVCRQRGHVLLLAGDEQVALTWRADGFHARGRVTRSKLVRSAPVHDLSELREAAHSRADLVFISPVFPTQSHPQGSVLGRMAFARLAKLGHPMRVIALGGMTRQRAQSLHKFTHGWAAIDTFRKNPR